MTTRQRILDEATRQLLDGGYSAFTVASVRDALGLSSGSMFHAFASRPALVAEIYVDGMRDYQCAAVDAIAAHPDAGPSVQAWIAAHLEWVAANRDLARFLFSTQPDEVVEAAEVPLADANALFEKTIADLLDQAVADGLMAPLPFPIARSLVIGAAQEYCRQWVRGMSAEDPSVVVDLYQRSALAAMRATLQKE